MPSHRDQIVDQFSRQAIPFSTAAPIRDERALRLIVDAAKTSADDTVLDVACGPGLVACAFARAARQVTGIDLTPAMIERAAALARAKPRPSHAELAAATASVSEPYNRRTSAELALR